MELLLSTFNMVAPIFVTVFAGYMLKRWGLVPESLAAPLNTLCFRVLLPCLCVRSVLAAEITMDYVWLAIYVMGTFIVSAAAFCVVIPKFVPDRKQAGVVVQGAFRSNSVMFGMQLMTNVCGEANIGPIILIVSIAAALFPIMAVVVLSYFSGEKGETDYKQMFIKSATNPLVVGTFIGLVLRVLPVSLPTVILQPVNTLASCATPMAMLAIGLRLSFSSMSANRVGIAIATVLKVAFMPLVWTVVGYAIGFREFLLCAVMLEHLCPCATAAVPMADAMGFDGKLAGEIIVVQTIAACLTAFIGVYTLRYLGLLLV